MYCKEFLKANDIQIILGIGRSSAYDIMHMFLQRGQGIRIGMTYRVRSEIFFAWHSPNMPLLPTRQFKVIKGENRDAKPGVIKEFLTAVDIQNILDIGHTKALEVFHELLRDKRAFQYGRIFRVRRDIFYNWLSDKDGYKPGIKLHAV